MTDKKILLVDDSSTILLMEKMILARDRYQVVTATDGAQAVETAVRERPDVIVMDVVMPKMDGFTACRALRAHEDTKGIPVVLVTTRGEPENVAKGYAAGCTDYVTKPIAAPELLAKLRSLLGAH